MDHNKKFVLKETAQLAREKGFDDPVFARYHKGKFEMNRLGGTYKHNSGEISSHYISAPTKSELATWLRDNYFYHPYIVPQGDTQSWTICNVGKTNVSERNKRLNFDLAKKFEGIHFNSYEEALEAALQEILNLI